MYLCCLCEGVGHVMLIAQCIERTVVSQSLNSGQCTVISDEVPFQPKQHTVQRSVTERSASLFSGCILLYTDNQSPLEGVPTQGTNSKHTSLHSPFSQHYI